MKSAIVLSTTLAMTIAHAAPPRTGDVTAGKAAFAACASCHQVGSAEKTLAAYIRRPDDVVPGTNMRFNGWAYGEQNQVDITQFMDGYKAAWEQRSTGTNLVARKPGDPLPRMTLDGVIHATFSGDVCSEARIWWHSLPDSAPVKLPGAKDS
ncbi:MAG: hypothetical protein J7605_00600 [Variovorax sp.]|nr:hypothetical protein [Variovorax sp.]